jgi:protein ImuA
LDGGFVLGAVHELVAASEGAPAVSLALRTATQAAGPGKWIFYIDTRHELYPPALAQLGVPLGRLMVVRTSRAADAWWVCEQVLRCQAVAAVVLPLRTIDAYASRRLQLAAEAGQSLGLLICQDQPGGHTFAASRLRIEPHWGPAGVRHLRITILKLREGRPGEPLVVEWPNAADFVPASAVPVDRTGAARRCASG